MLTPLSLKGEGPGVRVEVSQWQLARNTIQALDAAYTSRPTARMSSMALLRCTTPGRSL